MKTRINFITLLTFISIFLLSLSFSYRTNYSDDEWFVPPKYKNLKNTAEFNNTIAKTLWYKHCKSCHGKLGNGDGPKAEELDTEMMGFSAVEFQSQSDGELFYKTMEGREEMPSFKKKIPLENDVWNLIHYIRTMK